MWELIEPVSTRIRAVEDFIADVSDSVVCLAEPIEDPFGPSTQIPDLEVSYESYQMLNRPIYYSAIKVVNNFCSEQDEKESFRQ